MAVFSVSSDAPLDGVTTGDSGRPPDIPELVASFDFVCDDTGDGMMFPLGLIGNAKIPRPRPIENESVDEPATDCWSPPDDPRATGSSSSLSFLYRAGSNGPVLCTGTVGTVCVSLGANAERLRPRPCSNSAVEDVEVTDCVSLSSSLILNGFNEKPRPAIFLQKCYTIKTSEKID